MKTHLVPTLAAALTPGQNTVFCATLGLAWSALRDIDGSPAPALAPSAPAAARALDVLAAGPPPLRAAVPEEASFVAAGGPDELRAARAELRARFPDREGDPLPESLAPGGRFAFAMLDRALRFDPPFEPTTTGFAGAFVKGFRAGADQPERAANVVVHDHLPGDSFVIELRVSGPDRLVILAQVPPAPWAPPPPPVPPSTLAGRTREALSRLDRLRAPERVLRHGESFTAPNVHIDEAVSFPELTSAPVPLAGGGAIRIDDARQSVRFSLDEKGAIAQSDATLLAFGAPPRIFTVSGPFLVLLLRRGSAVPYLAAWIETASVMERAPDPPSTASMPWKLGPPSFGSGPFGGGSPAPFGGPPAPFGGSPAPFGGPPAPFGGGSPAPFGGSPAPFGGGSPAPFGGSPAPFGGPPAPFGGGSPGSSGGSPGSSGGSPGSSDGSPGSSDGSPGSSGGG